MTPCQKIKREILQEFCKSLRESAHPLQQEEKDFLAKVGNVPITDENVEDQWNAMDYLDDALHEYVQEFRSSGIKTGLPCESSRHYCSKSVARKLSDGSWVGWTYFYGGGKHGEPESIDWMGEAYDLDITETEKLVVVREFKRKE
jgi:hypothetical protein